MTGDRAGRLRIIERSEAVPLPRGPFMRAKKIAADPELFNNEVSPAWVLRNVPNRVKLGHSTVGWYRQDVEAWIASRKQNVA